jgi:hypothetical protein
MTAMHKSREERMVACALTHADLDFGYSPVTDPAVARRVVDELLGAEPQRAIEREPDGLGWLVEFTEEELGQLREHGFFGLDNDGTSIEAEWP